MAWVLVALCGLVAWVPVDVLGARGLAWVVPLDGLGARGWLGCLQLAWALVSSLGSGPVQAGGLCSPFAGCGHV